MTDQVYTPDDLLKFLTSVDAALSGPESVTVIEGSASVLHYGVPRGTRDIDALPPPSPRLVQAIKSAEQESGLKIPFQFVGVAELPENYEDRLEKLRDCSFVNLTVLIPEAHDLVLARFMRGDIRDFEAAKELHSRRPLDADVLVSRYLDEMGAAMGDQGRLDLNVYAGIESVFGEEVATAAYAAIRSRRDSGPDGPPACSHFP